MAQVRLDSKPTPAGDGFHVRLTVITSDGVEHQNLMGAHFTAKDEAELQAAITAYADAHEAMVAPVEEKAALALDAKVGKVLNAATFVEEAQVAKAEPVDLGLGGGGAIKVGP